MTTYRSSFQDALQALRQWESDTESPASASEGNAFLDGFVAGRNFEATPIPTSQKPKVFILEYNLLTKGWSRSIAYPNLYTEEEADAIIVARGSWYRKKEIAYA